jgi:hypothetical protein
VLNVKQTKKLYQQFKGEVMTANEIYAVMIRAGFPGQVAVTMTAIALRESSGDPNAFNGNEATGDRSYGLLQINLRDPNVCKDIKSNIASVAQDEKALFDPETNARAGYILWNGHNENLNVAWYINKPVYQQRYESHLPAAQAAALEFKA